MVLQADDLLVVGVMAAMDIVGVEGATGAGAGELASSADGRRMIGADVGVVLAAAAIAAAAEADTSVDDDRRRSAGVEVISFKRRLPGKMGEDV